jgi:hypothetical protein
LSEVARRDDGCNKNDDADVMDNKDERDSSKETGNVLLNQMVLPK